MFRFVAGWQLLFLPFLVALPLLAGAQHRQVYYLDLHRQQLQVPAREVYVEQVLDGRMGTPALGLAYRSNLGQREQMAVLCKDGLAAELTALLHEQLPQRATDHAVVLCVRQLRVSEVLALGLETAAADMAADVYAHLPDGYHLVRSVAAYTSGKGGDVTGLHAPHVAQLLAHCLQQLAPTDWALVARQPSRTLAQLPTDQPAAGQRPAIGRVARPRRGIYRTFDQFLANQPDTTGSLELDTLHPVARSWEGTLLLRPRMRATTGKNIAPRDIWGFSTGTQAYIRHNRAFRPLTPQGAVFTFVGAAQLLDNSAYVPKGGYINGTYTTPGVGLLEQALADGTGTSTPPPMAFAVDMQTGQPGVFPPLGQPVPGDTAYVYVYRDPGGAAEAQRVFIDNKEVAQLRPGEYRELLCPHFGRVVRLSLGEPSGSALLLVPSTTTATYVKLRPGRPAPWHWMPTHQGEAEVDALEKRRKP